MSLPRLSSQKAKPVFAALNGDYAGSSIADRKHKLRDNVQNAGSRSHKHKHDNFFRIFKQQRSLDFFFILSHFLRIFPVSKEQGMSSQEQGISGTKQRTWSQEQRSSIEAAPKADAARW